MIAIKDIHPKLESTIHDFVCDPSLFFYGEFSLYINFKECNEIPTAGVTVTHTGMQYLYNREFIDSLNPKQLKFLHIHELFHLLCGHSFRGKNLDAHLSNIVMDMIINTSITTEYANIIEEPDLTPWYVPKEYEGPHIFEALYDWMLEQKDKKEDSNSSDSDSAPENNGNDSNGDGVSDYVEQAIKQAEVQPNSNTAGLDVHLEDEVESDYRDQIVKGIKNGIKAKGNLPSNIEGLLERLCPPKTNYVKALSAAVSNLKTTSKARSFIRPSRRGIKGIKGYKKTGKTLTAILDVSGSMHGELEKVLSFIFYDDYVINLIQCDARVQKSVLVSSKKELQKMMIKGYGGTELQPAIDYAMEEFKTPIIVLTDGYCDNLNFGNRKSLVITSGVDPGISGSKTKVINIK